MLSTTEESEKTKVTRKRIKVSLRPDEANSCLAADGVVPGVTLMAEVASVEDHGYVMNMGYGNKLSGFLRKKEVGGEHERRLIPGAVVLCVATKCSGKVIQLSTRPEKFAKPPLRAPKIDAFIPGTLADILVTKVSSGGLVGKILGSLDATADVIHSGFAFSNKACNYEVGSRHKARVTYTFPDAENPKVGVSFLHHLIAIDQTLMTGTSDGSPLEKMPLSSIIENCTVRRVEPGIGLFIDLGHDLSGFVHISRVSDGKVDSLREKSGPHRLGSVHRGRVLGYNSIDRLFQVSFEQSVLEQPYLRLEDVPVGEVVQGMVEKVLVRSEGISLIVKVADGIAGLVTNMHLSDVTLSHPERRFREGMKVKARVLSKDVLHRKLRLTLKKTLINSKTPPIQSFDQVREGMKINGTIAKFVRSGACLQFYGKLWGFLPNSLMSEAFVSNPQEHFHVGQVLDVHVIEVAPDKNRLIVSRKDPSAIRSEKAPAVKKLKKNGDAVSGKVVVKAKHDEQILPGYEEGLEAGGFDWNAHMGDSSSDSSESNGNGSMPKKRTRRRKRVVPEPNADPNATGPHAAGDFERLLLTNPDDSSLWIQYIAFQIDNVDLAKGREIAEKAVETINPREQAKRLNVWTAYLNVEIEYGTEETLQEVFIRACQYHDEREVHERLISIYIKAGKYEVRHAILYMYIYIYIYISRSCY